MATCYVLPGFCGSQLYFAGSSTLIWPDYWTLAKGGLTNLKLHPDGVEPSNDGGNRLFPDGEVNGYLQRLAGAIERDTTLDARVWAWDWRKDLYNAGVRLAQHLLTMVDGAGPHSIVAHSAGGLVARFCYGYLKANGKQALIRRIVTLGTPHRGSLNPVKVARGQDAYAAGLSRARGFDTELVTYFDRNYILPLKVLEVAATWPGLFQLYPLLDAQQMAEDPLAESVFNDVQYPSQHPFRNQHLIDTRLEFQPTLKEANYLPPYEVLTTVAGIGRPTAHKVIGDVFNGYWPFHAVDPLGDGTVHYSSAHVATARRHNVYSDHGGIVECPDVLKHIGAWLNEVRVPITPVPVPVEHKGPMPSPSPDTLSPIQPLHANWGGSGGRSDNAGSRSTTGTLATIEQTEPRPVKRAGEPGSGSVLPGEIDVPDPPYKRRPARSGRR